MPAFLIYWGRYGYTEYFELANPNLVYSWFRDNVQMKKILSFFLLLISFLTPTFAFASYAATARNSQIMGAVTGSRANTAMSGMSVSGGVMNGILDTGATVGGSSASVSVPFSLPIDAAAAARSAAGLAGKIAGGYVAVAGAQFAVQKLLDGVGYVMDPANNQITFNDPNSKTLQNVQQAWRNSWVSTTATNAYFTTADSACSALNASIGFPSSNYTHTGYSTSSTSYNCHFTSGTGTTSLETNPKYNPSAPLPPPTVMSHQQVQDAMYNWMINNPTSVTDPVYQNLFTPAQTTGWNLTGAEGAHYGVDGLTDEMISNILGARDNSLKSPAIVTIKDSAAIVTPDGTSTTTTNNPDGSKKVTNNSVTTDKGKRTTTSIETTTNVDGTQATKTTTQVADAVDPTLPAACEWFATACSWFDWTKKDDPITDDPQLDQKDIPTPDLTENSVSWGSQCPTPQIIAFNLMGQSANIVLPWTPVCTLLSYLYYPIIASAYIAAAYIVIGAYKS
ncbi:virulence factor TspB C-terminal domain-related protein [Acinetobacter sp. ANC 4641]|uniref:virulence factor TspB C-terminal domain-related protein n=1 Tax=Acinetobacter sp. ANC 4641 TaxID=2529847 RepID=UPI0010395E66|nr:virulence factor TspB C-terminal domain-related protein [Acinetobacter sp. ANC 4641]TCB11521.1 hypothetical protein E0H78_07805 [Acinetobacter sp. ANC 4641]